MPIALVRFQLTEPISKIKARALFEATADRYLGYPDLVRKSYFRADDGMTLGAIYEWRTRAAAGALYNEAWRTRVAAHYGAEPELIWLETPVVVDNLAGEIRRN